MKTFQICCIVIILVCELFAVSWCGLPKGIQKCNSTDNDECIRKTVEKIFRLYPTGNSEFGMPDISALNISNLKVSKSNPTSPIQINFEFLTCTVNGIEKAKILKTVGFDKQMKNVELDALIPDARLYGDYVMNGKILLLPINGKGKGEIKLRDSNLTFRVRMTKEQRNNKTYFKMIKFKVTMVPKIMIFNLENLFNGNAVLSQTLNDVLNENWKDVSLELQDGINSAIEKMLENVINDVYSNLSIEEMYAD